MKQSISLLIIIIVILIPLSVQAADLYVVAVFDLKPETGVSEQTAQTLSNLLRKDLAATHKMVVMDRNDMNDILREQGKNLDDCSEEGCEVELGQILDTDKILVGNVSLLGGNYMLYAKMVDLESGKMMFAKNVEATADESELTDYITQLAEQIAGEIIITGEVLESNDSEVLVNLGNDIGVNNGASLIVERKGNPIQNQLGEIVDYNWEKVAELQVIGSAGDKISRCQILKLHKEIQLGDRVKEIFGIVTKQRGNILFTMEPGEVFTIIDGAASGKMDVSSNGLKMKFSAGSHSFTFSRTGKQDWSKTVTIKAGETVQLPVQFISGQSEQSAQIESSGYGVLAVRSDPTGATIFIDGVERGVTTYQVKSIAKGTHTVEVSKPLYKPHKETIIIEPDDILNVMANLEEDFGRLSITSEPTQATIYLNDQRKSFTPYEVDRYQSGEYELRVTKDTYHDHKQNFTVDAGGSTNLKIDLKPAFGSLRIGSTPSGVRVMVDDQDWGTTPVYRDIVFSGRHTVLLQENLYNDYEQFVTVKDGEETKLDVVMNARFGTVNVSSTPVGADVYIEGQVGSIGTTPLSKKLEPGIYNFSLQHELFESCDTTINLSIGDEVDYSPKLVYKTGSVTIFTDPPDVMLYLDGKELGLAPQMLKNYPTGDYEIEAKPMSNEYATFRRTVRVKHNEKGQIDLKLQRGGSISVTTDPSGARISVDGEYKGVSPITIDGYPAGKYEVTADWRPSSKKEKRVRVSNGENTSVMMSLKRTQLPKMKYIMSFNRTFIPYIKGYRVSTESLGETKTNGEGEQEKKYSNNVIFKTTTSSMSQNEIEFIWDTHSEVKFIWDLHKFFNGIEICHGNNNGLVRYFV